jgi:hypothetical protein
MQNVNSTTSGYVVVGSGSSSSQRKPRTSLPVCRAISARGLVTSRRISTLDGRFWLGKIYVAIRQYRYLLPSGHFSFFSSRPAVRPDVNPKSLNLLHNQSRLRISTPPDLANARSMGEPPSRTSSNVTNSSTHPQREAGGTDGSGGLRRHKPASDVATAMLWRAPMY